METNSPQWEKKKKVQENLKEKKKGKKKKTVFHHFKRINLSSAHQTAKVRLYFF